MTKWSTPHEVDDFEFEFEVIINSDLYPSFGEVPEDFRNCENPWVKFAEKLLNIMDSLSHIHIKAGIDPKMVIRHLQCIKNAKNKELSGIKYAVAGWFLSMWCTKDCLE